MRQNGEMKGEHERCISEDEEELGRIKEQKLKELMSARKKRALAGFKSNSDLKREQ